MRSRAIAKISLLVGELGMTRESSGRSRHRVSSALGLTRGQFPVAELFWGAPEAAGVARPEQPLVMIVDDIHAAETTLLDLLDHLVEHRGRTILLSARHATSCSIGTRMVRGYA